MTLCYFLEDTLPKKLSVIFSKKINCNINAIYEYNQNKIDALSHWHDYIEGIKRYISNPSIAWDYANKYTKFPNGSVHLRELGYDVAFIVKTNSYGVYVYVFKVDLKPQEFGLKVPPYLEENNHYKYNTMNTTKKRIRLSESKLRGIIAESVKKILNESREKYMNFIQKAVKQYGSVDVDGGVYVAEGLILYDDNGKSQILSEMSDEDLRWVVNGIRECNDIIRL